MAKAVKKVRKSRSTASKVLKAVASLLPHKKATKKAKANSMSKSAGSKSRSAVSKSGNTSSKSAVSKSRTSSASSKTNSKSRTNARSSSSTKRKVAPSRSYADTLRAMAEKKRMTAKPGQDPAHAPGHRKIKIQGLKKTRSKSKSMNESVMIANSKADRIHQNESEQRRLIPGASIERKGRRG